MAFGRKVRCQKCNSNIKGDYSFCPFCGSDLIDPEKERKDFGMLGRNDVLQDPAAAPFPINLGSIIKTFGPMVNKIAKELEREMQRNAGEMQNNPNFGTFPNGIKIKIGYPGQEKKEKKKKPEEKIITESQIKKMSTLPRSSAKSSVKRINNKIIYELTTPGVESSEDIFISKLEKGYEIKALGKSKIYVNSLPIELPLNKLSLTKGKLSVEFKAEQQY